MDITTRLRSGIDEFNSENGLQILFLVVAGYMFVEAEEWAFNSRVFPQMMAAAVIVGTLLLIFEEHLPGPLQKFVSGGPSAFDQTESEFEEQVDETTEEAEAEPSDFGRPLNPVLFTAILIVAYVALGYLFSLLVVSPLFVAAYLLWFRIPWPLIVVLSVIAALIAWTFAKVIVVPVDRGILVGELLTIGVV